MKPPARKRVLVTGAASGIGRALVADLLRNGYDVAAQGRRAGPLEDLGARAELHGAWFKIVLCDFLDRAATDRALEGLCQAWPRIEALVLNAGISELSPLDGPDTTAFDRLLEVNLIAPFRCIRALLSCLPDGGRIVVISSVLGRMGIPQGHGYCAAKAGLCGLVRGLALDLAPRGITVNALLPGWVDTPMAERSIARQAPGMGLSPEEARAAFTREVPLGRFLRPQEVAQVVRFLLTEAASGITGQALNQCGGVLA